MQVMLPNDLPALITSSQPETALKPITGALPFKKTRIKTEWHKRVLFLDPAEIYARIQIGRAHV